MTSANPKQIVTNHSGILQFSKKRKFHLEVKTKYEITITFKNEFQFVCHNNTIKQDLDAGIDFKFDHFKRLREHQKWFQKIYLPILKQTTEYSLYLEISDPQVLDDTHWPRIHYHGTILFPNYESLLFFKLMYSHDMAQFGRIQINEYRPDYWQWYIKKDLHKVKRLFKKNNCKYYYNFPSQKKNFFK